MMLIVIDSSVIVKWFFLESLTQEALAIRQDWLTSKIDLIAPELILAEVGNIVWKKHRLGLITEQEGIDTWECLRFRFYLKDTTIVSILSLLALGTLGAASTLKRKLKPSQSTEK